MVFSIALNRLELNTEVVFNPNTFSFRVGSFNQCENRMDGFRNE